MRLRLSVCGRSVTAVGVAAVPRLMATADGRGHWRVLCPHCRHVHTHGGVGRRYEHCTRPGSPFLESGYILDPGGGTTVPCPEHLSADIEITEDSNGWTAFQCEFGCWLGSIGTPT